MLAAPPLALRQVVGELRPGASVYYLRTKPEPGTGALHAAYREYDALVEDAASQRQHAAALHEGEPSGDGVALAVLGDWASFEAPGAAQQLFVADGLHLSGAGYALWNTWVAAALTRHALQKRETLSLSSPRSPR